MTVDEALAIQEAHGDRENSRQFAALAPELNASQRRLIKACIGSVMYPIGSTK
jgi:hypothetical protein